VVVKFNPKVYANEANLLKWVEEQLIPLLENQPTLLVLDLFGAHKTQEVLGTFLANDITISLIPGGCTSLVQPLDVSINCLFKDILKVGKDLPLLSWNLRKKEKKNLQPETNRANSSIGGTRREVRQD